MRAPEGVNTTELAAQLQTRSVLIEPGAPFFESGSAPQNYYRLGYSSIPASKIPEGVRIIGEALRNWP